MPLLFALLIWFGSDLVYISRCLIVRSFVNRLYNSCDYSVAYVVIVQTSRLTLEL